MKRFVFINPRVTCEIKGEISIMSESLDSAEQYITDLALQAATRDLVYEYPIDEPATEN